MSLFRSDGFAYRIPSLACISLFIAPLTLRAGTPAAAQPAATPLTGRLSKVGNLRVLSLWGTPHERGYAQGRLIGREILTLADRYVREWSLIGGPEGFAKMRETCRQLMVVQPPYEAELRGMVVGMRAELGDTAGIAALGRPIEYDDLLVFNCLPDLVKIACSSFAAWGSLTADGHTLSGRNLDWFADSAKILDGHDLIIAEAPDAERGTLGWVSVTWPGMIICLTGMNSDGVTVCIHDSAFGHQWKQPGSTPRCFTLREAIESAHAADASDSIARILRHRHCVTGNNIPVSMPFDGTNCPSVVFEYDGDTSTGQGVTIRYSGDKTKRADATDLYELCVNDYRVRGTPLPFGRFSTLTDYVNTCSAKAAPLTIADGRKMLESVGMDFMMMTQQSVIFEPNECRMHVAFSKGRTPATHRPITTLDVKSLLGTDSRQSPKTDIAAKR